MLVCILKTVFSPWTICRTGAAVACLHALTDKRAKWLFPVLWKEKGECAGEHEALLMQIGCNSVSLNIPSEHLTAVRLKYGHTDPWSRLLTLFLLFVVAPCFLGRTPDVVRVCHSAKVSTEHHQTGAMRCRISWPMAMGSTFQIVEMCRTYPTNQKARGCTGLLWRPMSDRGS